VPGRIQEPEIIVEGEEMKDIEPVGKIQAQEQDHCSHSHQGCQAGPVYCINQVIQGAVTPIHQQVQEDKESQKNESPFRT